MGIVAVADLAAIGGGSPPCATRTATPRLTRSAANARKLVVATLRPTVFDPYILALEISGFAQALMKVGHEVCIW
jgi:hypothetical protein